MMHALQVGGFEAYLLADDEKEGAAAEEVYRPVRLASSVCWLASSCSLALLWSWLAHQHTHTDMKRQENVLT